MTVTTTSGANGFVGSWIVRRLLDQGFVVHGAVRSAAKGDELGAAGDKTAADWDGKSSVGGRDQKVTEIYPTESPVEQTGVHVTVETENDITFEKEKN